MANQEKKEPRFIYTYLDIIVMLLCGLCFGSAVTILLVCIIPAEDNASYKKGQIDALSGKIRYELSVKPDSLWNEIKYIKK